MKFVAPLGAWWCFCALKKSEPMIYYYSVVKWIRADAAPVGQTSKMATAIESASNLNIWKLYSRDLFALNVPLCPCVCVCVSLTFHSVSMQKLSTSISFNVRNVYSVPTNDVFHRLYRRPSMLDTYFEKKFLSLWLSPCTSAASRQHKKQNLRPKQFTLFGWGQTVRRVDR